MNRRFSITAAVGLAGLLSMGIYAGASPDEERLREMEQTALSLPDSIFQDVAIEDLIDDEVYLKLAHDGWTAREIAIIMNTAVKDKAKARLKGGYGFYAKQWRPYYGRAIGNDSLYQYVDTTLTASMIASVQETVPSDILNASWAKIPYNPADRRAGTRRPGYFRPVEFNPSSGRIHHIVVNPNNADSLYVVADGTGIFSTGNCGETWTCITDRIPERAVRSQSPGYSIPVDPANWNHLFAFMDNSSVFETFDGGKTWKRVEGATHKNFKRAYCFRDKEGTLRFIGATMENNRMNNGLWISSDLCKTWDKVPLPDDFRETSNNGFWFQQFYFDPFNPDLIYIPGSKSILYFDNGARKEDGQYKLKRMTFNVLDQNGQEVLASNISEFPFPGDGAGHMVVNPNKEGQMWYALGKRDPMKTALFLSNDGGENWITLHNEMASTDSEGRPVAIGKGGMFGNEIAYSWLGGFGVNLADTDKMYGCSMSSAKSTDGGKTWTEFSWGTRIKSRVMLRDSTMSTDYYYVSASRHNADNHTIASHKSGRVFRGSDGGLFMLDPAVNGGEWTNISGNMGQMLFYDVRVNEFGDQTIIGNTQDIDVQTYRYGRWGNWRGYEGTEASLNPFSGTEYFSGGNGGGLDGMEFDSWHTARNYADVRTGSWYMLRTWNGNPRPGTLFRIDDIGGSVVDLYPGIQAKVAGLAMARDNNRTTLYVTTDNGYFYKSTDNGESFQPLIIRNQTAKFSSTKLAVDPNDSRYIYLGQNGGKVFKWDTQTGEFPAYGTGLPSINCDRLIFHEGSGDLYFVSYSAGIYILEKGSTTWRFWTRGYNGSKIRDCDINYTTQEMVIADYGRGVWVADLEHPSDRYFSDGFQLRELSNVEGRHTIGIDTDWTIPLYYNYEWTVNGTKIDNPYQYLVASLKAGDKVRLTLTLRESPDVKSVSSEFTVADSTAESVGLHSGNALYSDGSGRMDIGWMDWFYDDFTVDLWARPESDGVILANRQREADPDRKGAKGWMLYLEGGRLKFSYSPTNYFVQPTYEASEPQTVTLDAGSIPAGTWSHLAVTEQRDGRIAIYVDGVPRIAGARYKPDHSLNNSVCLSLFGDINERNCLKGSVDEIKIWSRALSAEELRTQMHSTNPVSDGLVAYYNFNADSLAADCEIFSRYSPRPRVKARPEYRRMTVPVCADRTVVNSVSGGKKSFADGETALLDIEAVGEVDFTAFVFGFGSDRWRDDDDNLDERYFTPSASGYIIEAFDTVTPDLTAHITFHNAGGEKFDTRRTYRLYVAESGTDKTYWKPHTGNLHADSEGGVTVENALMRDLLGRRLLIVELNPALELTIDGLNAEGDIEIYDEEDDTYTVHLTPVGGMKAPSGTYSLSADRAIIDTPEHLIFHDGMASDQIRVELDYLGAFNERIPVVISGETEEMIPVETDVVNRITPRELGNSVTVNKGGLTVGTGADFASLYGSTNLTMMGWIRIDDPAVITTGRGDGGIAPLIFFRGGNGTATGIHLRDGGYFSFHWNDESGSYGTKIDKLQVSTADIGKWMHYAMVVRDNSVDFYLNGMKDTKTYNNHSASKIASPLMLGQNADGNRWFVGAFDHVAVWNRALTDDEVRRYMQERVLLNDDGLVSYLTMDYFDENGRIYDLKTGSPVKEVGNVAHNGLSTVPFNPDERDGLAENKYIRFADNTRMGTVTVFNGTPYNYISADDAGKYYPLNREFYTLILDEPKANAAATTLTYTHPSVQKGDRIALGIRPLGDTSPMSGYIDGEATESGKITFSIPAGRLGSSSELIFLLYLSEDAGRRPLIVNFDTSDPNSVKDGDMIMLTSTTSHNIHVKLDVESANDGDKITLNVGEINYATVNSAELSLDNNKDFVETTIVIDPDKMDKFALNPVTVSVNTNVEGATVEPITFYVYLKPRVKLSLANGDNGSATEFTATTPYPALEINAQLIEGYLTEDVRLNFTPVELGHFINVSSGPLLLSQEPGRDLDFSPSAVQGGFDEGWNLIGNPYLADINLTKEQNRDYDTNLVTHYVYHTLPGMDNFIAYDMTDYTSLHKILPLQSFFVQAMGEGASFRVREEAKEEALSRKTFDYYTAEELKTIELSLLVDGVETDRTTIQWNPSGNVAYILDEDAPKIWPRNSETPLFYTLSESIQGRPETGSDPVEDPIESTPRGARSAAASEDKPLSYNVVGANTQKVDLVFENAPEGSTVEIVPTRMTGFNDKDIVYFNDMTRHRREQLFENEAYSVDYPLNSHTISIETSDPTGIDSPEADRPDYRIYAGEGECTVTGLRGNAFISIFNLAGLLVDSANVTGATYTSRLPGDIYIVRIRENGREFVSKIVVK